MLKRLLPLFILLTALAAPADAQKSLTIKQLEDIVSENQQDYDQVNVLNELTQRYVDSDAKKAERYAEDAESLADELAYQQGRLQALNNLASLYANHLDRHDKAVDFYEEAYLIYKQQYESGLIEEEVIKDFMIGTVLRSYELLANRGNHKARERRALREYQRLQGEFATYLAEFAKTTETELRQREEALDSAARAIQKIESELDSTETTLTNEISQRDRQIYRTKKSKDEISREKAQLFNNLVLKEFEEEEMKDSLMAREIELKNAKLRVLEEKQRLMSEQSKVDKLRREKDRQREQLIIAIVIGVLVLLSTIVIFLSLRRQKRLNQKLIEQKQELSDLNEEILVQQDNILEQNVEIREQRDAIQQKNSQITASINYAERIQQAILPTKDKILKYLPESFVFFRARDIVSGDFYWFNIIDSKIIISVIDCTGHGVPGAFMSMIGNTQLHEIIENRKITSPELILNEMHRRIFTSLRQDQSSSRDGMDMSICVIDKKTNTLEFAGAKRPLIYIQDNELHHVKGDLKAIGGKQRGKETVRLFSKHTLKLNSSPTMFYMFSDGYPDQFGGPLKRKFSLKRLKSTFEEIHHLPTAEQKQELGKVIDDWMQETKQKQLDDILVMGFKIP